MELLILGVMKDFGWFQAMRPTSKQNSAVISIRDNKPFYGFALGGNIESLALILVSAIFTESKPSPLQVLPIR